jgi:TatD DNase family protein
MGLHIIDTHAHLNMEEFDGDRDNVVSRSNDSGVKTVINVGIDMSSNREVIQLAEKYPGMYAVLGIHPHDAKLVKPEDLDTIAEMTDHSRVVAIGETGLDYYYENSPRDVQIDIFKKHLALADRLDLPVVIHTRSAQDDTIAVLTEWSDRSSLPQGKVRGVIHCFNTDYESAGKYMEMGFYFSIGGYIGYPSSAELREVVRGIPLERIMIETDCPFLPPQQYRGKRNEPSYCVLTAEILASLKGLTLEELAEQTTLNAVKCFNLKDISI